MERFIAGNYATVDTALLAVDDLIRRGYKQDDITLVANSVAAEAIADKRGLRVMAVDISADEDNDSMWERFKNVFSRKDEARELVRNDDLLAGHKHDLIRGNVIVLVESGLPRSLKDKVDDDANLAVNTRQEAGSRVIVPPVDPMSTAGNPTMDQHPGVVPPVITRDEEEDEKRR